MLLYNHLKHNGKEANTMLRRYPVSSLTRLQQSGACRMIAQIIHVKKGQRVPVYTKGADKNKKLPKTYDRLIFLRDLVSGSAFVVVSDSRQDSVVLFHLFPRIGDYVSLYMPSHSSHKIAEVQVVRYKDVFFPLKKPPCNKTVNSVPDGAKFSTFFVEVAGKDLEIDGIGLETCCAGKLCDGTIDNPCPCLGGTTVTKQAVSLFIKVPVKGLDDNFVRYRSITLTKYFFGPTVMKNLYLYRLKQVEDVVSQGLKHVEKIMIAGWIGYTADVEDDVSVATRTHVTSLRLQFKTRPNGQPVFEPIDDLQLPEELLEEVEEEEEHVEVENDGTGNAENEKVPSNLHMNNDPATQGHFIATNNEQPRVEAPGNIRICPIPQATLNPAYLLQGMANPNHLEGQAASNVGCQSQGIQGPSDLSKRMIHPGQIGKTSNSRKRHVIESDAEEEEAEQE